jgi:hypothetical protein
MHYKASFSDHQEREHTVEDLELKDLKAYIEAVLRATGPVVNTRLVQSDYNPTSWTIYLLRYSGAELLKIGYAWPQNHRPDVNT